MDYSPTVIKYQAGQDASYHELKRRVNSYFDQANISRFANRAMRTKTLIIFLLYFVPFFFLLAVRPANAGVFFGTWFLMGWGVFGIGTAIMHDSNHHAYSSKRWVNRWLGNSLNLIGGYAVTWRIRHNILHHTYTNVPHLDDDIENSLVRLSPYHARRGFHRWQHFYAWLLYPLLTLRWVTLTDFKAISRYRQKGLQGKHALSWKKALALLIVTKGLYYLYILGLPIWIGGYSGYQVITGFLVMHLTAGMLLTYSAQPAHVLESSTFEQPKEGALPTTWMAHQYANTTNFGMGNRFFFWITGGLNFQIEHHLFPNICHVHYPAISPIVRQFARESGLPYNVISSFRAALAEHGRMLKKLGKS